MVLEIYQKSGIEVEFSEIWAIFGLLSHVARVCWDFGANRGATGLYWVCNC